MTLRHSVHSRYAASPSALLVITLALSGCGGGMAVGSGEDDGADENLSTDEAVGVPEPLELPEVVDLPPEVPDTPPRVDVVALPEPEVNACSEQCSWSEGAPMPDSSRGQGSVEYGGLIYLFGGESSADVAPGYSAFERYARELPPRFSSVRAYDPVTDTWTAKASMPLGLYVLTAHVIADKVYVFGGYGETGFDASVQEYDLASDSWQVREPMPTLRYTFSSEVIDGKVYVVGGNGPAPEAPDTWPYTDRVEIFDPNEGWLVGSPMRRPVGVAASCSIGSRMFVFGGEINNFTSIYDVESDTWSRGSPPPTERGAHTCVRIGDAFYLLGGRNPAGETLDLVEKYDPALDTWTPFGNMPLRREFLSAVALDRDIFVLGGIVPGGEATAWMTDRLDVLHLPLAAE